MLLGLVAAIVVLVLDQLSKYYVAEVLLSSRGIIMVTDNFNIIRAWNTGVSFSMFNNWGLFGAIALSAVALMIVTALIIWLHREKSQFIQLALGFIIGGAIGNVIDRILLGAVFDFLDFHVVGKHWPAFNLADSFICIGAVMIIAHGIIMKNNSKLEEMK